MDIDELMERLERYAASYLPEWSYQREAPETETALLTALGSLLESSSVRLNHLPQKHEEAFLDEAPIEARGAISARTFAALASPIGEVSPAGKKFYLAGDGARVWTSETDTWASQCTLVNHILAAGDSGKLIPLQLPDPERPAALFDTRASGAQRRVVRFSHPDMFASRQGCSVLLTLEDTPEELISFLTDKTTASWKLEYGEDQTPIPSPVLEGSALRFELPPVPSATALLAQAEDGAIPPVGSIGCVLSSTERLECGCDMVLTVEGPCQNGQWLPFGEDPEPWQECQIACGEALSLRGAVVTATWNMILREHEKVLPGMDQEPEYKPVMRRLPPVPPATRDVFVSAVVWEYWNGVAWMPIPGTEQYGTYFGKMDSNTMQMEVKFTWPEDAVELTVQGMTSCWLRWRIRTVENSGWLPRRVYAPELTDLRFSAVLRDAVVEVEQVCGLEDGFSQVTGGQPLFPALTDEGNEWWLGFSEPPEAGPLRLYLSLERRTPGGTLSAWEGTSGGGRRQLQLEDGTDGLSHSGMLTLDAYKGGTSLRFGQRRWWLCLRDEGESIGVGGQFPQLTGLVCGAAILRSEGADTSAPGDPILPLHGGAVSGTVLTDSFGGLPEETDKEYLLRARAHRHHLGRAVSAEDIEQVLRDELRDVARTYCIRLGDYLELGVLLRDGYAQDEALALREPEIRRILAERSALPTLGLSVKVRGPRFYPIQVTVWLHKEDGMGFDELRWEIVSALDRFLDPVKGNFSGRGWRFASLPTTAQVEGCIQKTISPDLLAELTVDAMTPEGRLVDAASVREPFAMPVSGTHFIYLKEE